MRVWEKILLGLLLFSALLLRTTGISHDLHEGRRYHPDSPKQVRAVQQFLGGQYYKHLGRRDYDGYPLFHARMTELIIRTAEPVCEGFLRIIGIPAPPKLLGGEAQIYWIFLVMNVFFSTAIVLIVFRAGRESIGPPAGWIAALLLTVSPADVTCAHLATGDAATAFFAALALFHCLRVHRLGRTRDYAFATLAATFAFAAKYYAATAFFALAFAHIARVGLTLPAAWFDRAAIRRIAICAVVAIAALLFAIPGLIENFTGSVADIRMALLESTQRYPLEIERASKWVRYKFSMRVNLPDLFRCISPVALFAIMLAPLVRLRDPRVWILLVGPALYVFLAVGSRGLVNPIYHTAITPPLFLLIALCATWAFELRGRLRLAARCIAAAAISGAATLFALDTAREVFFAAHMDTRRLSETWAAENIPKSFHAHNGRYTFLWQADDHPGASPAGDFAVRSELDPGPPGAEGILLRRWELERSPLTQFRNIEQRLGFSSPGFLNTNKPSLPAPRWPSQTGNEFIFADGAEFIRSERVIIVSRYDRIRRWLVSERPLDEAWIGIQAVAPQSAVVVTFSGTTKKVRVGESATDVLHFANPSPHFPTGGGLYFYPLRIEARNALVKITLATSPDEAARMLMNMGREADAAKIPGATIPKQTAANPSEFLAAHGVHPDYLDALPFLRINADKLGSSGFALTEPPRMTTDDFSVMERRATPNSKAQSEKNLFAVWTAPLLLDPAAYRGKVFVRSLSGAAPAAMARLIIRTVHGETLDEKPLAIPPLDARPNSEIPFRFTVPRGLTGCSILLRFDGMPDLAISSLEIRPAYFPEPSGPAR